MKPYRIGILGGMGPMAGVVLQQRIIEATPAQADQDHIEVICFTNPHIPDRTQAIIDGTAHEIIAALQESAHILERAGASVIAMPCNAAHAYIEDIQKLVSIPIMNMIELTIAELMRVHVATVGLLATDGALRAGLYERHSLGFDFQWIVPTPEYQQRVMDVIYRIKGGETRNTRREITTLLHDMKDRGFPIIVLGCTELSIYADDIQVPGVTVIDPLSLLARELVRLASLKHSPV